METRWKPISPRHALALIVLAVAAGLTGCSTLGVRPPADALTPVEHLNLGISYEHAGKLDLALREYERAAVGAVRSRALTCQGNIFLARQQWPEAEARYRAALELEPNDLLALNNLAWLLGSQGRSLDEAERLIRHALTLNPEPRADLEDTLATVLAARGPAAGP